MERITALRKMDELGRVVIPIEIRRTLKINEGSMIEFTCENDGVYLKKYEEKQRCSLCWCDEKLLLVEDRPICISCVEKINRIKI